jgi:hypothetical protein
MPSSSITTMGEGIGQLAEVVVNAKERAELERSELRRLVLERRLKDASASTIWR